MQNRIDKMLSSSEFVNRMLVVKEELDDTYKQAHIGLNQWSLLYDDDLKHHVLQFDLGYLIGLTDKEGIQDIDWEYQVMSVDQELLASNDEVMREATPDRTQIFVQGARQRELYIERPLVKDQSYIIWFTLNYNDEVLKEQLFELVAGGEGGDPTWIDEIPGGQSLPPTQTINDSSEGSLGEDIVEEDVVGGGAAPEEVMRENQE